MNTSHMKLVHARSGHCSTLLGDGTVLITGGISPAGQALDTAELVSPATPQTRVLAGRHLPRAGHRCIALPGGLVLLIGGANATGKPEARIETFDPKTERFAELARLGTPRMHHQAVLLPDQRALVVGGRDGDGNVLGSAEWIDPVRAGVSAVPVALNWPRDHPEAVLLENGLVLITGGAGSPESRRTAELFDPTIPRFLPPIAMHEDRVIHTTTLLGGGRAFSFSNGRGEVFDAAARHFVQVPGRGGPPIRDGHTATLLADGRVLILGGVVPEDSDELLGAPVLYDPGAQRYLDLTADAVLVDRAEHAAVRLPDGTVLITGGRTLDALATDDIIRFDPKARTFRRMP
jgi:hypothetical protein